MFNKTKCILISLKPVKLKTIKNKNAAFVLKAMLQQKKKYSDVKINISIIKIVSLNG